MTSKQIINKDSDNRSVVHSSVQYLAPPPYAAEVFEARGIYRLPIELLVEIFKTSLDLGVPRATIACLNKYCNAAVISSPVLWNHITLWLSTDRGSIHANRMPYLKRCLELSQGAPLSVRLDSELQAIVPGYSLLTLRSVLHQCDTPRWQSLTISHDGSGGEALTKFKFSSLKSLTFIETYTTLSWHGSSFPNAIFAALLRSRPRIEEIVLPETIAPFPASFFQSSILHSLRVATTSALMVLKLPSPSSLQVLHITGPFSNLHLKDIQLPLTVSLQWCSTHILTELRLERTQYLTIKKLGWTRASVDATIKCPELRSLSVIESGFSSLVYIAAPKLADVCVGMNKVDTGEYRERSMKFTIILLRDLPHYLKCQPRFLTTRLPLTTEETILLLERWPQLEKISIRVARPFRWRTWLAEGLVRKRRLWNDVSDGKIARETWKICPRLRWLHLVTDWSEDESTEWRGHVKRIFRERGPDGLACISWVCADGSEVACSRD